MKTVYKYTLGRMRALEATVQLEIPLGANYLELAIQSNEYLCLWALVDTAQKSVTRHFKIVGTGNPITENLTYNNNGYIGTVHYLESLVFHVFEFIK